jgi:hypothetical protein
VDKNSEYGLIYSEIARGYSKKYIDGTAFYFKHPTQVEYFGIYNSYNTICEDAKSRGLPTEAEQISDAIKGGWWTEDNENKITDIRNTIARLIKTKSQLLYPSQKKQIDEQIQSNERFLVTYIKERNAVTGYTVERYANEKFYDEMILSLTFKNSELTNRVFSSESEYYYLTEDIVESIREGFAANNAALSNDNLKLVAATGFFQNLVFIADTSPFYFWGKAAVNCSRYQIDILMYAKMIKNLIKYNAENGNSIDEDILNNPDRLVKLLDNNSSTSSTSKSSSADSSQGSNKVTSYVGATKQDLKDMGVKIEKIKGKSLLERAKENGGVLDKYQYMNVRENM